MRRRALLSTFGTSAVLSTAGCLDAVGAAFDEPMHLARFTAFNDDVDRHTFDLRVDRNGEVVHQSSHRIQGKDDDRIYAESADCGWGTAKGNYEVFARVDDGEWTGKILTEVTDDWRNTVECATAEAWFGDQLAILLDDDCDKLAQGHWDGACPLEYSDR